MNVGAQAPRRMALAASRGVRLTALAVCAVAIVALAACAVSEPYGGTGPSFGEQVCGTPGNDRPGYRGANGALPSAAQRLSGAGSTFVAPVMSVWARRYADERGVRVAYQPIGSGGGVAQVTAGTVDFGATDTPMTAVESAKAGGRPVLHIPVTLGAVVPAYHVNGVGSGVRFDGETLGRIYSGAISRWNDPALRDLNPTLRLPDLPIVAPRSGRPTSTCPAGSANGPWSGGPRRYATRTADNAWGGEALSSLPSTGHRRGGERGRTTPA